MKKYSWSDIKVTINLEKAKAETPAAKPQKRQVTREEFESFIHRYPSKLEKDFYAIADPPWLLYHDFERGEGWDALVAGVHMCSDRSGGAEPDEYWIFREAQ